mmetsp:Transcript_26840/g.70467  ORF Transcript_26840/g.70467 Transcript_26840/m.70467 type:complete len:458 (-) Transcript_26840:115-1488(-)
MAVRRVLAAVPRASRGLASLAEVDPAMPVPEFAAPATEPVQATTLANGVTVISEDSQGPASSVSIIVGAGSSTEPTEARGSAAFLRAMAFKGTESTTAFRRVRECELRGITLDCVGDHESITYSAEFVRAEVDAAVAMLGESVMEPTFTSWDVADAKAELKSGVDAGDLHDYVLDEVHAGAFRSGGLGNSVFCDDFRLPAISHGGLAAFHASKFTAGNITVVGSDIAHADLVAMAQETLGGIAGGSSAPAASAYVGGFETRLGNALDTTLFSIGFEGAARGSADAAASAVVEKLLFGNGFTSIPYGSGNAENKVVAALSSAAGTADLESFNANYESTGLIGATVTVPAAAARPAITNFTQAIMAVLDGRFSEADIARAKAQATVELLEMSAADRAAFYAAGAAAGAQPASPEAFAAAINAVTAEQVTTFAGKVGQSKAVTVAMGNVDDVPFRDELGL